MISPKFRLAGIVAIAAIVVGACSSAATPSPAPTAAPTAMASEGPTALAVATVPADQLIAAGTLTVCSDTSYPPQETLDSSNVAVGSDIDIAAEIAKRLGLKLVIKSTVFDTIIPALQGGSCDIIISAQTITDERKQVVDMVPYFAAGQSFVVLKGNPDNINAVTDLCGKAVAAEKGTIEADNIAGTGSGYDATNSLDSQCKAAGKPDITLQVFDADTNALAALQAGTVVAHFTDEPVAGYEVVNSSGAFEMVPSMTLERGAEGISVLPTKTGLEASVKAALLAMMGDGTYMTILNKWGVESGAVTAADVNAG